MFLSTDAELSSHDETNTAEIIDQMFEEVLEYAGRIEEERGDDEDTGDHDSGIGVNSGDKDKMDTESEKEKEDGESKEEEHDESKKLESNRDELLTFPHSGILSPLSESVEAVVTPLVRKIHNFELNFLINSEPGKILNVPYSTNSDWQQARSPILPLCSGLQDRPSLNLLLYTGNDNIAICTSYVWNKPRLNSLS